MTPSTGPVPQPPGEPVELGPGSKGHGTFYAYQVRKCRCTDCQTFMRRYAKRYTTRKRRRKAPEDAHGLVTTYNHYGCRCDPCKAARRSYDRERYEIRNR